MDRARYLKAVTEKSQVRSASHPIELPKYVLHAKVLERKSGLMKIHLSNGRAFGTFDLHPATLHNLKAFAKTNRVSLINMVDLAIRFTTDPDKRQTVDLACPAERSLT